METTKRDLELFERISRGDRLAYNQLFRIYYTPLCRYCNQIVNNSESAEELVSDLLLNLWIKAPGLKIHTSLKTYLYQSIRYAAWRFLKNLPQPADSLDTVDMLTQHPGPHEQLEQLDLAHLINEGLQRLPDTCREIFLLHKVDGFKYREIAEILKVSEKTVENQLMKALRMFREFMKDRKVS